MPFKLNKSNKKLILIMLFILCVSSFFISIGNGAVKISYTDIIRAILRKSDDVHYKVICNVRIPRTLVAGLVGINLSLSGSILQGIMRNPLASPRIIGVSSGAGLAALIILILFPDFYYLVPVGAFLGAFFTTLIIYTLAWKKGADPNRLILSGVAVSTILGSGTNTLITFYPDRVSGVIGFMVGGLSASTWINLK